MWRLGSNRCSPVSSTCAPRLRVRGQQCVQYPWSQSVHWYLIDRAGFRHLSHREVESRTSLNVLCGLLAGYMASYFSSESLGCFKGSWSEDSTSQYLKSRSIAQMASHRSLRESRFLCTLSDTALVLVDFRSSQATPIACTVAAIIAKAAATNGPH